MKIKQPNNTRANKKKALARQLGIKHYWLIPDKARGVSRLSSRNKVNKLRRRRVGPSEFRVMAVNAEGGDK